MNLNPETIRKDLVTPANPTRPECRQKTGIMGYVRKLRHLTSLANSVKFCKIYAAIVVGNEKYSSKIIRSLYIGHGQNFLFLFNTMYSNFEIIYQQNNINALFTKKWIEKYTNFVDIIVVDVEFLYCKFLPKEGFLQVPPSVKQKLDISDTWQEVRQSFRKHTRTRVLSKLRKRGFTYRITKSEEAFRHFYYRMYSPYIRKRYGDEAIIYPQRRFLRICRKCSLLRILHGEEIIAAVVLYQSGPVLTSLWMGASDTVQPTELEGSLQALFYFQILFAYEQGCHKMDFHESRPLLNHGVFQAKRKWGAYVEDSPYLRGDILLRPLSLNEAVCSFFTHNHFITRGRGELTGKILLDGHVVTINEIERMVKLYFIKGLDDFEIFSLGGFEDDVKELANRNTDTVKLFDLSSSSQPEKDFCRL